MRKRLNLLWNQEKDYMQLASVNCKVISEYNEKILSALTLIGGLLMLLPLLAAPFSHTKTSAVSAYFLTATLFFTLFFIFKLSFMKKYALIGLYVSFSVLFLFAIYLSVIHSPNMRATILLGAFCIMPLGFIDRPARINLFVAFWFTVHTILAFYLKPQYALDDTINSLCFAILGCFIGNIMVWVRLESYEAHRLLTIEKETDVLTGLFNRRKLFETLAALETTGVEKPSGILMIDIDHFKDFNDNYGHAAGDKCLGRLGEVFTKFTQDFRLYFYRYGGEEFVAMAYGYDAKELLSIAESLRIAVQSIDMDEYRITVSIGVAYCGEEQVRNYENIIDRADKAAYAAKRAGRNKVCMEQNEITSMRGLI
ncbi:MAG: GGDEF domain-containing protein [Desulfotomaculaceae bacterium]|nr:GGDEF domain-containing protein [Desulfotomaculaceae bacterium]MDD4767620.1 GGDEF domain-containing protein [Desulfotomaculaceae bacterium]